MNDTLQDKLVARLAEKGYRITFAESCTGGLCAGRLVDVANASAVFDGSVVTYANHIKTQLVGVDEETIAAYGVVSEPVALKMAKGAAKVFDAQVAVGVSGIAGPSGGSDKKPVGTVCFGFTVDGNETAFTKQFGDIGRNNVRNAAVDTVYTTLLEMLA